MNNNILFQKTKIKMVMRLRGVPHDEAVKLIKRNMTANRKYRNEDDRLSSRIVNANVEAERYADIMTADVFFGRLDR